MKVISYGEDYKPKTIICSYCKSELEYDYEDIYSGSCIVVDKEKFTKKEIISIYVSCPVCGYSNTLGEKYTYREEPLNTPKKWFIKNKKSKS